MSESHRVDEINLSEKFQSIGVGDPKRRWACGQWSHLSHHLRAVVISLQGCLSV